VLKLTTMIGRRRTTAPRTGSSLALENLVHRHLRDRTSRSAHSFAFGELDEVPYERGFALLAQVQGRTDDAIARAREAAEREESMPFMFGPPFVDKPSYELLGEILLAAGRKHEAAGAFRASLDRAPGRALSVEGLAAASR
jgi:hypothetical protein